MISCISIYDLSFANKHSYTSTPYTFRSFESSNRSQNHYTKNNWPNFNNVTTLDDEEWAEEDIKEFTKLMENSEKDWKPFSEELETIDLGTKQERKELKIGTLITAKERERLISLLHEYTDVFAWTYAEMPGLDTGIVVHKIPLIEGSMSVKQKNKRMRPNMLLKVKAEIQK